MMRFNTQDDRVKWRPTGRGVAGSRGWYPSRTQNKLQWHGLDNRMATFFKNKVVKEIGKVNVPL